MKFSNLKVAGLLAGVLSIFISSNLQGQDLKSAALLTRSEQYDMAEQIFKQLIQKEPTNSKYYFFYGENVLQDFFADTISNSLTVYSKTAKDLFDKGVTTNPSEPLNYIGLARVAFFNGDDNTAEEMRTKAKSFLLPYKNIKKIVPPAKEYALVLAKIAESYIDEEFKVDSGKALPYIRQALTIDSKSDDIYLIAGDIFNLKNDGSSAIKYYNLAQDYNTTSPTANMKIGSIYVRARNLDAAIPFFDLAIKLNGNYAPAYRELGALYASAHKYDLAKLNLQKYLELTQGNIPAKIKYVIALYFAGEYDEVIKNVEEIFAVDKSKAYMNRLAGYSCYEKKNADYEKALSYMETLFKTVSPELINKRDYLYTAKILLKKNPNYKSLTDENDRLKVQLEKEKTRYASASPAEKTKMKTALDTLTARSSKLNSRFVKADGEVNRAFGEYYKALAFSPGDKVLINEIATAYYNYQRYEYAAKTWTRLIAMGRNSIDNYMQIGKAYYVGANYNSADSIFNVVIKMDPAYLDAYVYIARTYSRMESDIKTGKAKPKFEKVLELAASDPKKYSKEIVEAYTYLGYHFMLNDDYLKSKEVYTNMINLAPDNKEYVTRGYQGLGQLDYRTGGNEKTIEGRLPYLARSIESYNKILAYDPTNESVKTSLKNVQDFEKQVKAGINPNELKGTVKNAAGQPIPNASVRVKDTAAEIYTNSTGAFKFEIPQASEVLIISAKGYKPKEIPVTRPLRPISVTLEQ